MKTTNFENLINEKKKEEFEDNHSNKMISENNEKVNENRKKNTLYNRLNYKEEMKMKSIAKLREMANNHPVIAMVSTGILTGGIFVYIPETVMAKITGDDLDDFITKSAIKSNQIGLV